MVKELKDRPVGHETVQRRTDSQLAALLEGLQAMVKETVTESVQHAMSASMQRLHAEIGGMQQRVVPSATNPAMQGRGDFFVLGDQTPSASVAEEERLSAADHKFLVEVAQASGLEWTLPPGAGPTAVTAAAHARFALPSPGSLPLAQQVHALKQHPGLAQELDRLALERHRAWTQRQQQPPPQLQPQLQPQLPPPQLPPPQQPPPPAAVSLEETLACEHAQVRAAAAPAATATAEGRQVVVVLGPPSADKESLCASLAARLGGVQHGTAAVLAAAVTEESAEGQQVAALMDSGKIVPTTLVQQLVVLALRSCGDAAAHPHVLPDFPRSSAQLSQLEAAVGQVACVLRLASHGGEADRLSDAIAAALHDKGRHVVHIYACSRDRIWRISCTCARTQAEFPLWPWSLFSPSSSGCRSARAPIVVTCALRDCRRAPAVAQCCYRTTNPCQVSLAPDLAPDDCADEAEKACLHAGMRKAASDAVRR